MSVSKLAVVGASSYSVEPALNILSRIHIPDNAAVLYASHVQNIPVYKELTPDRKRSVRHGLPLQGGFVYIVVDVAKLQVAESTQSLMELPQVDILNAKVEIRDGNFFLKPSHILSVDDLMEMAIQSFRERCIGAILNGWGQDGSKGIKNIHSVGGRTIVLDGRDLQDPDERNVMPKNAVATGCVDFVLPEDKFREKLEELLHA